MKKLSTFAIVSAVFLLTFVFVPKGIDGKVGVETAFVQAEMSVQNPAIVNVSLASMKYISEPTGEVIAPLVCRKANTKAQKGFRSRVFHSPLYNILFS